jgi:hypothetical protein
LVPVPVPLISNADLEKTKPKFIHSTSKIILQYSFFFKFVESTTSTVWPIFLELCSNLYDLSANGIKAIQHFTIYLNSGLDSFLEIQASILEMCETSPGLGGRDQKNYTLPGPGPKEKLYRDQNRNRKKELPGPKKGGPAHLYSIPIPVVETGISIRLVEHISSYSVLFFLCYKIFV